MKREHNSRYSQRINYDQYDTSDTRYYGAFLKGDKEHCRVRIDPKRYQKTVGTLSEEQLRVINRRHGPYFFPAKESRNDYMCHIFADAISEVQETWINQFRPIIHRTLRRLKKPREKTVGDCELMQCGILDFDEAQMDVRMENWWAQEQYISDYRDLASSLYAQFLHQFASQVEATTVRVLTTRNAMSDRFDRNVFYATAASKGQPVQDLPHFSSYDKLYGLWNFLKHNSMSTYETLKKVYPEILIDKAYKQGEPAFRYVMFSDKVIQSLISGNMDFFKEYCQLVFDENWEEAQWNYDEYFLRNVHEAIELVINPLGLPWWL